ncbi:MAG: mevalonate kinase family protein [Candidatus Hodarchaeales archaeon]
MSLEGINNRVISCSVPSRICLFGEHSDYLGLPIIAAAINRRMFFEGALNNKNEIILNLKDLKKTIRVSLNKVIAYEGSRDYLRSCITVYEEAFQKILNGFNVKIWSNIPIGKGLSSSSALCVGWLKFLHKITDKKIDPLTLASLAHKAEVVEFNEPGGIMDHYTSALESFIFLECTDKPKVEKLKLSSNLKHAFIIGDSLQTKDTIEGLARLKMAFKKGFQYLENTIDDFDPRFTPVSTVEKNLTKSSLPSKIISKTNAILKNRDLTLQAYSLLKQQDPKLDKIGKLLSKHHAILRDSLKCSTPQIEKMIHAADKAGACGSKIVGSGSGGCMISLVSDNAEKVINAIEKMGAKAFSVDLL